MRIALFHNTPSGGAKRAIYEWIRRLAKNHDIDVFTLSTASHHFCDIRPLVRSHRIYEFKPRKLFCSPWGRMNQLQRWRDLGELTRIGSRIASDIDSMNLDIVFAHTCLYASIPSLIQFLKTPSVYYLHEPFGPTFVRPVQRPFLPDGGWRKYVDPFDPLIKLYRYRLRDLQAKSIAKAKLLLANSEFTKAQIYSAFKAKAQFCPLGVNCDDFHPIPVIKKDHCVLSVGEMTPRKGFDFLIISLAHIPEKARPALRLVSNIVDVFEKEYLEQLATHKRVHLEILTHLNTEQLVVEYNRASLCVYAPLLEPFGLVPLEAMACGLPVVGVREGGVQEIIIHGQTGLLIERDPRLFAEAIFALLGDPAELSRYGRNSREQALRHWSWDDSVAKIEKSLSACARDC
ncbi:MAG: glycosyltransferase family 4 protein [Acidobacteria bacterium]|nr:glycosyltransferase family 4 protein [Acidobacteriota bacterium]